MTDSEGHFPVYVFFLIFLAFCHLVCAKLVVLFGVCHLPLPHLQPPSCFVFRHSPLWCHYLGVNHYDISVQPVTERAWLTSSLVFPLLPILLLFFLKRELPLLPTTFFLIPSPNPLLIIPPYLLFFPVVDGRESQVCDNNYTYTQKKIMLLPPFNKFAVK